MSVYKFLVHLKAENETVRFYSDQLFCTLFHTSKPSELLNLEPFEEIWDMSSLQNDPSAGMSACITGIFSSFLSPTAEMSKSASFTQASKALSNFSPPWLHFPGGVCLSLWIPTKQALMASLYITWVNCIPLRKMCTLCSTSDDIKWKRTLTWHYSSSHKRNGCRCTFLLICVELNVLKPMSDTSTYKSSQCEHSN